MRFVSLFLGTLVIFLLLTFAYPEQLKAKTGIDLSSQDKFAKQITVLVKGGTTGSGIILSKKGNTYYILTVAHFLNKANTKGVTILTPTQEVYRVKKIRFLPPLDLAVLEFISDNAHEYDYATVGNSDELSQGEPIVIGGFPEPGRKNFSNRIFSPRHGYITYLPLIPSQDGYGIGYDSLTPNGMSGGPVLDENKCLVAVHGQRENGTSAGIPINLFSKLELSLDIALYPCVPSPSPASSQDMPQESQKPQKPQEPRIVQQEISCPRCDFTQQNLQNADLKEADFQGADFSQANLQNAMLYRAILSGADLSQANLQGANLQEANLQDADLTQANLQNADLRGANLKGADLAGANRQGTKF